MAWIAIGAAVLPSVYKGVTGIIQSNKASKLHPVNPGYQINQQVVNNAKTLSDEYGNYQIPGYSKAAGNINTNFANAFSNGVQGATSGADVLDLATRMAYGKNQAFNNLDQQNASGKQSMLGAYLNANAAAGQEYQNKNAYDRGEYDKQVREKAALTQAGAENTYGALDQLAGTSSKYLFSMKKTDGSSADAATGDDNSRAAYNRYYYPDGSPRYDANGNPIPSQTSKGVPEGGSSIASSGY